MLNDGQSRSMRDAGVRQRRRAMLTQPHIAPLTAYAVKLRQHDSVEVPDFDPLDGGVNAQVLFLFEKPGPMAAEANGSAFISRNNDDLTAEATFRFMEQAGIPRKLTITWNVIPWWNGTRRVTGQELREGVACVRELITLLPKLRVVVLVGGKAAKARVYLEGMGLAVFMSAHPSPLVRAKFPERWNAIPSKWADVLKVIQLPCPPIQLIRNWQQRATRIAPPENTAILPARGGLPGPAFFPEGFGLQSPSSDNWPTVMAIGHNFGCANYRSEIDAAGREDDKATWRNLRRLLADAEVGIESCYMTNWFVGLQPGNKQVGDFLAHPSPRYEAECRQLLLDQIEGLKPSVILLLGLSVVVHADRIMPALSPWAGASNWSAVDASSIGPVTFDVKVPGTGVRANVVALLHPSFSPSNQRHRRSLFPVSKPEVEMIRRAVTAGCSPPCREFH